MTIANASAVLAADLNTMASTSLGLVAADNAQLPLAHEVCFTWQNVTATVVSNNPERLKCVFVVPFDCFIETVAIVGNDFTASSAIGVVVSCPGLLEPALPLTFSATIGTGINKLTRILYDNTRGSASPAYASVNPALRILLKGATATVSVTTNSSATPSSIQVTLLLRSTFNRG